MDTIDMAVEGEAADGGKAAGRRHRVWSIDDKRRIVAESFETGASVSVVARRHDLNTNQLFTWRRQLGRAQTVSFVPAAIAAEMPTASCSRESDRIEIVLVSGARVIVGTDVDETALSRVIKVVSRTR